MHKWFKSAGRTAVQMQTRAARTNCGVRPRMRLSSSTRTAAATASSSSRLKHLARFAASATTFLAGAHLVMQQTEDSRLGHLAGETVYSREEVAKHNNETDGYWVTYGDDVFDVTDFIEQHPGGDRIMLAVGGTCARHHCIPRAAASHAPAFFLHALCFVYFRRTN